MLFHEIFILIKKQMDKIYFKVKDVDKLCKIINKQRSSSSILIHKKIIKSDWYFLYLPTSIEDTPYIITYYKTQECELKKKFKCAWII